MKKYSHLQVLTVRELQVGEVLHAGRSAGLCVEWKVFKIADDKSYFIAQIGNSSTYLKLTGKDIRDPAFPMFRKPDCPLCAIAKLEEAERPDEPTFVNAGELHASDVPSSLSNVEAKRRGENKHTGGAHMRSHADRRRDIVERAKRALMKQQTG